MANQAAKKLTRFNRRHHEVLMWVLLNPHKTQRELAAELGYTEAWLSTLMASDMFQEKYKEMQDTFHSTAFLNVRTKTEAAASMAVDRLMEILENDREKQLTPGFILEATTKLLEKAGTMAGDNQGAQQGGVTLNFNLAQEINSALGAVNAARQQLPPIEETAEQKVLDDNRDYSETEDIVVEPT